MKNLNQIEHNIKTLNEKARGMADKIDVQIASAKELLDKLIGKTVRRLSNINSNNIDNLELNGPPKPLKSTLATEKLQQCIHRFKGSLFHRNAQGSGCSEKSTLTYEDLCDTGVDSEVE